MWRSDRGVTIEGRRRALWYRAFRCSRDFPRRSGELAGAEGTCRDRERIDGAGPGRDPAMAGRSIPADLLCDPWLCRHRRVLCQPTETPLGPFRGRAPDLGALRDLVSELPQVFGRYACLP